MSEPPDRLPDPNLPKGKQKPEQKSKKSKDPIVDVDEGLIDVDHPHDSIQGESDSEPPSESKN